MDGQPFGLVLVLLDCIVLLPGLFRFLDVTPERREFMDGHGGYRYTQRRVCAAAVLFARSLFVMPMAVAAAPAPGQSME